jgi:hypothetical protein
MLSPEVCVMLMEESCKSSNPPAIFPVNMQMKQLAAMPAQAHVTPQAHPLTKL